MTSLTLVVVCHMRDIGMLRLQARSIALYAPHALFARILVIENDSDGDLFAERFITEVLSEYGDRGNLVQLVRRDCLALGIGFAHGWRSQQILKLLSARLIQSDFMLILDAKNHFIRPINDGNFISPDGRPRTHAASQRGNLQHMFKNSFELWGLDAERFVDHALPNITPFAARRSSIVAMVDLIEVTNQCSFQDYFLRHDVAEFYLFAAFIAWRDGLFTAEYAFGEAGLITIFADKATSGAFASVTKHIERQCMFCFGVHWQAIEVLTNQLKHEISAVWVERGLVNNIAEGFNFLTL